MQNKINPEDKWSWNIDIRADNVPISMHVNCTEEEVNKITDTYVDFHLEYSKKVKSKITKCNNYIKQYPTKEAFFPFKKCEVIKIE